MSKRPRSPSPITVRTRANVVRFDTTNRKDADYIGLALDLIRLFNHFGADLFKKLVFHIVEAEIKDHVFLHSVPAWNAPPVILPCSSDHPAARFDNAFVIERTKWWSRLFANVLRLRAAYSSLNDYERNFWKNFNHVIGTLKPNAPFILSPTLPGRHFLGEWMRFTSPLVGTMLFHLDGTQHRHEYRPKSMTADEFYALFPKQLPNLEEFVYKHSKEIEVSFPPNGYPGGPGLPFTSLTARELQEGEEEYVLKKRMFIWKEHVKITPGTSSSVLEWKVDREIGKSLVDDFNSDPEDE